MKRILIGIAGALTFSSTVFALDGSPQLQNGSLVVAQATLPVSRLQTGSGQKAGGPAREAISETGGAPAPRRAGRSISRLQSGSGQKAGGPAREAISETGGRPSVAGTAYDPTRAAPPQRGRSGQSAAGPRAR
jgi:hypothetical protein